LLHQTTAAATTTWPSQHVSLHHHLEEKRERSRSEIRKPQKSDFLLHIEQYFMLLIDSVPFRRLTYYFIGELNRILKHEILCLAFAIAIAQHHRHCFVRNTRHFQFVVSLSLLLCFAFWSTYSSSSCSQQQQQQPKKK